MVGRADRDLRADRIGLGHQQRMDAIEADRYIQKGAGVKRMVPGKARGVGLGIRVGVLSGHKLESHHLLIGEGVLRKEFVVSAEILIEAKVGRSGVDRLRRVGVEGPGIDVRAVRRGFGISIDPSLEQAEDGGVVGERRTFTRQRNQNVPVDAAPQLLLRTVDGQASPPPETYPGREAVVVFAGGLDTADLKERSCAQNAVRVREKNAAMEVTRLLAWIEMDERCGIVAKLRAKVFALGLKLGDDGRVGAEPKIELLESIVIDEIELQVFVAPALAGGRVGCAEKIEFGAFAFSRLLLGYLVLRRIWRRGLVGEQEKRAKNELKHVHLLCQGCPAGILKQLREPCVNLISWPPWRHLS